MSDLIDGLSEMQHRLPHYRKARRYADGTASEVFASSWLKKGNITELSPHYILNVAGRVVSSRTDLMKTQAVRVLIDGEPDEKAREVLQQSIWLPNRMDILTPDYLHKGVSAGDVYLIVWPNAKNPDHISVLVNSAESCRVFYEPDDPQEAIYAIKPWLTRDKYFRVDLYYPDRLERFISRTEVDGWREDFKQEDFRQFDDDNQPAVIPNPWGKLPVFHGRTGLPYGKPEHRQAYGPQNAITKLAASHMSAVDDLTIPIRVALSKGHTTGADLQDWDSIETNSPTLVEESQPLRRGDIWKLHDTDSVHQLDAAPASSWIDPISSWIRYLSVATGTPMDEIDPTGQAESGESRRAKRLSLVSRVEYLKSCFGGTLEDALELGLEMLGEPGAEVSLVWAPSDQMDSLEDWQMVKEKQASGVPVRESLIEAGNLPEEVDEWLGNPDPVKALEMAERIATLSQQLGSAVQLGGLSSDQAQQMINHLQSLVTGVEDD